MLQLASICARILCRRLLVGVLRRIVLSFISMIYARY
jgi:hypothetical protein